MDLNKAKLKINAKLNKKKLALKDKIKSKSFRLRLSIYKSCKNIHVQIIDDLKHHTLCSISTLEKSFKESNLVYRCNINNAEKLALMLVTKIKEKGISKLILNRNGYKYHGIIKKLAEVLRDNGVII